MDISANSPVSAFAIYKQNKANNTSKRNQQRQKKRKQKAQNASKVALPKPIIMLKEEELKKAAKKVQEQKRTKKRKNIGKKNTHKTKSNSNQSGGLSTGDGKKPKETKRPYNNKTGVLVAKPDTNNVPTMGKDKYLKAKKVKESKKENVDMKSRGNKIAILEPASEHNPSLSSSSSSSTSSTSSSRSSSSQDSFDFEPVQTDSIAEGLKVFHWIIAPYKPKDFLENVWEKKPLCLLRKRPNYYKEIISTPIIDNILRKENIKFNKNLDITSYVDGKRETHNPDGRAHPHVVWDYYLNGCSVRFLNPQTYIPKLHLLNATLQDCFNSFVGANAYLTPPVSQGFAPHYDDIEAFILQIEGKKRWKIYHPLSKNEELPRVSSKNFEQDEIGDPISEVVLEDGDLLYLPRGYIHQAETIEGVHSLHITISMYQNHSWADLFEKMIPAALQAAINDNIELRKGLPFDIYDNFGYVHTEVKTQRKKDITEHIKLLCDKIKYYLPMDKAVDDMAKVFQHAALPPVLTDLEKCVTVFGDSDVMGADGKVSNRVELGLDTRVRLLRKNILRMVMEEEGVKLYYNIENSLEYHGNEQQSLDIDETFAPAIETLIMSYPQYVFVENLDIPGETEKLQVANDLWERGLIMTEYPMDTIED